MKTGHTIAWDKAQVIDYGQRWGARKIKESLHIKRERANRQIMNRDGGLAISRVWQQVILRTSFLTLALVIFVLRKKGSKTKKRMKEEEIEKGDCGPPTRKVFFFLRFCRTWTKQYLITSQTRVKRVSRIHHRTILTRLTLICEVIRYRFVQVRQNLKKRLAFVQFFENWKRFPLQFECFYYDFFPAPFGTKPLPWFVFSLSDLIRFLFSSLIVHLRRGTQLSRNVMGKKWNQIVG